MRLATHSMYYRFWSFAYIFIYRQTPATAANAANAASATTIIIQTTTKHFEPIHVYVIIASIRLRHAQRNLNDKIQYM